MTIRRPTTPALLALLIGVAALAFPALAAAQGGNNATTIGIPTLDGLGLTTLAGALALAGSWVVARRRTKK